MCEASSICPAGRGGAETDREAFEIVAPAASSACAVAASERRVWSTRASAHAAVRSHNTRNARVSCVRGPLVLSRVGVVLLADGLCLHDGFDLWARPKFCGIGPT